MSGSQPFASVNDVYSAKEGALRLRFDASTHPDPLERVEAWRDAFAASVDISVAAGEIVEFSADADFRPLGPALLADTRFTDHTVVRDRRTIARTGGEQIILDVFTKGGIVGRVGSRPCRAQAGDCFIMDMRGTFRLQLTRGRFIGFIMPRNVFQGAAIGSALLHGRVLPAGTPNAILIQRLMDDHDAMLIWMSHGAKVDVDEARRPAIPVLMTLGAPSAGADAFDAARLTLVLTEDKNSGPVVRSVWLRRGHQGASRLLGGPCGLLAYRLTEHLKADVLNDRKGPTRRTRIRRL